MGRTKRKRNKRQCHILNDNQYNAINLQKSLKLKCANLQISHFNETGRGIKCKRKIYEGDTLITLHLNQLITSKTNSDVFSVLNIKNHSPHLILSVWLVYETHLKTDSEYYEYVKSLPKYYTNLYFCTEEETKLLPEFLKKEVEIQNANLKEVGSNLKKILEDKKCPHCDTLLKSLYSLEKFLWAWFTVNTRSVYYEDESNSKSLALAPFLDMFNHSDDAITKIVIDFENRLYILKTLVKYKKFDQVFIKYGPHSNLKLLIEYGFLLSENPHDYVEFSFQEVTECVKEFDFMNGEITKLKFSFIKKNKLNQNLTKNKEEFSWNFNGLIYVLITKDQNLSLLESKTYSNDFTSTEHDIIKKIKKIIANKKKEELERNLMSMNKIEKSSESFRLAKNLVRIYINLLV